MKIVEVFAGDYFEGDLVSQVLEEHGIKSMVQNELMSTIAPWYITAGGNQSVSIQVNSKDYDEAMALIKEIKFSNDE